MREIRPSGSEGGVAYNTPSLPLFSGCPFGTKPLVQPLNSRKTLSAALVFRKVTARIGWDGEGGVVVWTHERL